MARSTISQTSVSCDVCGRQEEPLGAISGVNLAGWIWVDGVDLCQPCATNLLMKTISTKLISEEQFHILVDDSKRSTIQHRSGVILC